MSSSSKSERRRSRTRKLTLAPKATVIFRPRRMKVKISPCCDREQSRSTICSSKRRRGNETELSSRGFEAHLFSVVEHELVGRHSVCGTRLDFESASGELSLRIRAAEIAQVTADPTQGIQWKTTGGRVGSLGQACEKNENGTRK